MGYGARRTQTWHVEIVSTDGRVKKFTFHFSPKLLNSWTSVRSLLEYHAWMRMNKGAMKFVRPYNGLKGWKLLQYYKD